MRNFFLFITLLALAFTVKSQDTLKLKDGRIILCRIVSVDSTNVNIEMKRYHHNLSTFIKRDLVESMSKPASLNELITDRMGINRAKVFKPVDTLFLKDGRVILCKIISRDSSKINLELIKKRTSYQTYVENNQVLEVKYHKPIVISETFKRISKRSNFYASYGYSIPRGAFAKDDVHKSKSGFAGKGVSRNIGFKYYYNSSTGISFKGVYNTNEFVSDKLNEYYSALIHGIASADKGEYKLYGFFVGPTFRASSDKLTLEGHLMLGATKLNTPDVKFHLKSIPNFGWVEMCEISATSLIYDVGFELNCALNKKLNFLAGADYMQGSFSYGDLEYKYSTGYNEKVDRGILEYGVFNLTLGLQISF